MTRPCPHRRPFLALWVLALLAALPATADNVVRTENVTARLVAERSVVAPGETVWLGLELAIRDGWHTYWRNPGDSGEATRIDWRLPAGVEAGDIAWPAPERIPVGPLVNFGYHGTPLHLVPVSIPSDWPGDRALVLEADARWLVCDDVCIPEEGSLTLELPVGASRVGPEADRFDRARRALPVESPWPATFSADGRDLVLTLALDAADAPLTAATFFPFEWGVVEAAAEQAWSRDGGDLALALTAGDAPPSTELAGVLVLEEDAGGETLRRALTVTAVAGAPAAGLAEPPAGTRLFVALALAVLGGLLLNLMPCVFPVLSLKAMELVSLGSSERGATRRAGLAYTAGVLVFFLILGLLLLALRGSGAAIGWGFQLQWPPFVAAMAYLMFALGLMMLGVVELGGAWMGVGDGLTRRHGWQGSFFTGALAALVATPCTAPFMGAALGYALTQPAPLALAVMLALGVGLALPFLLLGFVPGLAAILPRPGPWMARLRGMLAFPLFATAVWLLWVLARQIGADALALVLAGFVGLAWGLWAWREARGASRAAGRVLRAFSVVLLLLGVAPLAGLTSATAPDTRAEAGAQPYSETRLTALRAQGQPVFVNLTAAWCITCQVNERVVLATQDVRAAMERLQITYLKGDWTNRDPAITALLARYDRAGVPLYLLYPAGGGEPRILPQILTESLVVEALTAAATPPESMQTRLETSQ